MKNKIIFAAVIFSLIPSVAMASWWNPLSWFESKTEIKIEQEITEPKVEPSVSAETEEKNQTEPIIKERVVEKTITVDNPETQKRINALLQENANLKSKVDSLTSSLNICKATTAETSSSGYSDFNFSYVVSTNRITFPFSTSRDIVIKKAVFHIRETDARDTPKAGSIQRLELITSTGAKPIYYNLENNGDSTFTFLGTGIPLKGKETLVANVSIDGKENETFYMVPDFSEWEVWDNTTDKPAMVK